MAFHSFSKVIRRTLLRLGGGPTDGELLRRFAAQQDQAAFAELVQRHGAMVLRVCQRVLEHAQDAEDAYQAAFIVLARKAPALAGRDVLAGWLHEVAQRVALEARRRKWRHAREKSVAALGELAQPAPAAAAGSPEVRAVLDEEIRRLPEKYRQPVVLCYLEGKTNQEAVEILGSTIDSVRKRLLRARALLRRSLTRRGLALSEAALAALLAQETASAAVVPVILTSAAVQAGRLEAGSLPAAGTISAQAISLADATLQSMAAYRLRAAVAVLVAVFLIGGVTAGIAALAPSVRVPANSRVRLTLELPTEGLVGHYAFNEGQGTRVGDASPSGNHGILEGDVTWTTGPKPGSKALHLDGKTGYIQFGKDLNQWLGGTATLSFWIKTRQAGRTQDWATPTIAGCHAKVQFDDNDINWGLLMANGRCGISVGNRGGVSTVLSARPVNDGTWHHMALTRDAGSGTVQVFLDGALEATAVSKKGSKTTPFDMIGRLDNPYLDSPLFFQGSLGEMCIYNRVTTREEIRQLAAAGPLSNQASAPPAAGALVSAIRTAGQAYPSIEAPIGSFVCDMNCVSGGVLNTTSAAIDTSGVHDPAPQAVYQTERVGNFTYTIPNLMPGAAYRVRLHFAEFFWDAADRRLSNVALNNMQVLSRFDIFAAAGGKNIAVAREFHTRATGNGQIVIEFTTVKDNAKVSGIEIYAAGP